MSDRIAGLGNQLVEVHIWLREQIAALRAGVVAPLDVRAHCVAFCGAVSRATNRRSWSDVAPGAHYFPEVGPNKKRRRRLGATKGGAGGG